MAVTCNFSATHFLKEEIILVAVRMNVCGANIDGRKYCYVLFVGEHAINDVEISLFLDFSLT